MKRILVWLILLVLIGYGNTGGSIGTPTVKTTTWLNVPFEATDTTTGVGRIPDSVSVVVLFGNCPNTGIFQVSSASLDSNWWDSTQTGMGVAGSKIYYFITPIADIDADSGAGFYSGVINAWFQGYPMPTYFSFNLVDTTAQEYGSLLFYHRLSPTTAGRTLDVTANGEAGIDLDNASGTLDAGEIGADAITAAKIADDAIDYATFAATAPTAWWPEGKAGYKLAADGLDTDTSFSNIQTHIVEDSTNIEAVKAKTDDLNFTGTDVKATLDGETVSLNSAQAGSLNTLMADVDGIKAKSDSSSYGPSGHIKSTPQTDVTLSGGTISGIATANWAAGTRTLTVADWSTHSAMDAAHAVYETLYVHKADFHSDGDTNTNPFQAGTDSVMHTTSIPVFVTGTPSFYNWTDAQRDSLLNTILDANKVNYMRWTAAQRDSLLNTILDANKVNYMRWTAAEVGSLLNTVEDANKVNFMRWTAAQVGSLLNTVEDANKANFKATGFASSDSVHNAIADANKVNFKADVDSVNNAVADANKPNFKATWGDTLHDLAVDGDSVTNAIADANKGNFKYAGGADSVRAYLAVGDSTVLADLSDSVLNAIHDTNKANFKYGGGADSVRAFLATHDSTLLELAAACGSGTGVRTVTITVLSASDSSAISGFAVSVYDSSSGEFKGSGTTNSNGIYTCSLDDETYTVHIKKTPWTLTSPRRFVITADLDSTFYATPHTPSSPPADTLCVVYGWIKQQSVAIEGADVMMWTDKHPVTYYGVIIDTHTPVVVKTDSDGYFEFSAGVYPNSVLIPSNTRYRFRVETATFKFERAVEVPLQETWEISLDLD